MKPLLHLALLLACPVLLFAQTQNDIIDAPGDLAFVAYEHLGSSGYAFVLIDDCPNNTTIIFDDEEWNGTDWVSTTGEGANTWTNTTGSTIAAGTVITVQNGNENPTVNLGAISESDLGFDLAAGDGIFAYVGTFRSNSVTFLAFVGDTDDPSPQTLSGTNLSVGTHTFNIDDIGGNDEGIYTGSTTCNGTATECIQMINDVSNWTVIGGATTFPGSVPTAFSGSALPVELVEFSAKWEGRGVALAWQTVTEINNDFFTLERSLDGKEFKEIARVSGRGFSQELQEYKFFDSAPGAGLNYYRLGQVDYNGRQVILKVISVQVEMEEGGLTISPNPVRQVAKVVLDVALKEDAVINVFNVQGQLVQQQFLEAETNAFEISTDTWENGKYFLQLIASQKVVLKQMVKFH